ncbi:hypothetical protein D3C72_2519140 [compost metagenome]
MASRERPQAWVISSQLSASISPSKAAKPAPWVAMKSRSAVPCANTAFASPLTSAMSEPMRGCR